MKRFEIDTYPININSTTYEGTVLSFFKNQVKIFPSQVAIKFRDLSLTYLELDNLSDQVAQLLIEKGLNAGTPVGVLFPRSIEFIVSIMGILKAGGAYVPMNPTDGDERLFHIIFDSGCPFILTKNEIIENRVEVIPGSLIEIRISEDKKLSNRNHCHFNPIRIYPNNLAYLIYTSGSTGNPKGVMIEHKNLYWLIKNYIPKLDFSDKTLQAMSSTFDGSILEIFPTLCNGATLVLWMDEYSKTFRNEKITYCCMTPSMADLIDIADCTNLKNIMVGGEKLTEQVVRKFLPHVNIFNGYGPTETTVACSMTKIDSPENIHIGGKFDGAELYVVDPQLNKCPTGEVGELLIGGEGVGGGYWKKPRLTKEKFIPNPFGTGRLYRSGDMVKWNEKNELIYVGRADRQVKIRGFRLELDGVEKIINEFPQVTGSYIKVHGQNLIAFITPEIIDLEELKKYLERNLPIYALPYKFHLLNTFPLTSAGKIDEKKLPIEIQNLDKKEFIPETELEIKMESLWIKALSLNGERISLKDNFFDLGGSSLHAIKLIKFLNDEFKSEIPLEFIYKNPKLENFINSFQQLKKEKIPHNKVLASKKTIFIDAVKCLPSFLWFYFAFASPILILIAIGFYSPLLAIGIVTLEFLLEKTVGLPKGNILKKIKIFTHVTNFKYKSVKILEEASVESFPRTIYAVSPHGVSEDHLVPLENFLIGKKIKYAVTHAEILFKLPLSKTIFSLLNGVPAKKESYFNAVKENLSLVVTPGDAYEEYYSDEPATVVLKDNLHFFKYALETGTPLTPVYIYNYNKIFKIFKHFHQERMAILEKNKDSVIQPYYGRWFLPIPFWVDLKTAIGTPLPVQKIENPKWQDVEDLYERYAAHLNELYLRHAEKGAPPLKIL